MAGKKKGRKAQPVHREPTQVHPAAAANTLAQARTSQQVRHGTAGGIARVPGLNAGANTAEDSTAADTEPQSTDTGDSSSAAGSQQQQHEWQQQEQEQDDAPRFIPACGYPPATGPPVTAAEASRLVAQLGNSRQVSEQLHLLVVASSLKERDHDSDQALITAGAVPVLRLLLQSGSMEVRYAALKLLSRLVIAQLWREGPAPATNLIPQLVLLVRSSGQGVQYKALAQLEHMSAYRSLAQSIVAAGAIPAVTEALHTGRAKARLSAANLLLHLAKAGGMSTDTALAGAVPAAVSVLQCAQPADQRWAAHNLGLWTSEFRQASVIAMSQDALPALLGLVHSQHPWRWDAAAELLSNLVRDGKGAQQASDGGALPIIVAVLNSRFNERGRFHAATALDSILEQCSQAASIAAAAGAVPPLVRMLAVSVSGNRQDGGNSSHDSNSSNSAPQDPLVRFYCGDTAPITSRQKEAVAMRSLSRMAASGDPDCLTAMVAAGAVPAISAVLQSQHEQSRQLAHDAFQRLLTDPSSRIQAASHLTTLLRNSKAPKTQDHAMHAVFLCAKDATFRSAIMAAGAGIALVSLVKTSPNPSSVTKAIRVLTDTLVTDTDGITLNHDHAAALVEAGAIPAVAQVLRKDPVEVGTRMMAERFLCVMACFSNVHEEMANSELHKQVAEVIPQLLQAMQGDDEHQRLIGRALQLLARRGRSSVLDAFRAAKPQWENWLLSVGCSEAQHHAAAAVYISIMGIKNCSKCDESTKAMLRSACWIDLEFPPSQWGPCIVPGSL